MHMKRTMLLFLWLGFLVMPGYLLALSALDADDKDVLKASDAVVADELKIFLSTYEGKELFSFLKSNDKKIKLAPEGYDKTICKMETADGAFYCVTYRFRKPLNLMVFPEQFCVWVSPDLSDGILHRDAICPRQ